MLCIAYEHVPNVGVARAHTHGYVALVVPLLVAKAENYKVMTEDKR